MELREVVRGREESAFGETLVIGIGGRELVSRCMFLLLYVLSEVPGDDGILGWEGGLTACFSRVCTEGDITPYICLIRSIGVVLARVNGTKTQGHRVNSSTKFWFECIEA